MSSLDMAFDGAFASAAATIVSNPFDVVRTRMQLQGQMKKAGEYEVIYKNLFQAMGKIAKEEGVLSLQKGFVPAVLWQITQNGIRIGLYPLAKTEIGRGFDQVQDRYLAAVHHRSRAVTEKPLSESHPFFICVFAGALCGVVGSIVASPFVMVKTRLQSEHGMYLQAKAQHPKHSLHLHSAKVATPAQAAHLAEATTGTQFHYTGVLDALRKIYKKGGVRGLWHGATVAAQRTMIGSAVQLTSYDYCRALWANALGYPVSDARMHILAAINASMFVVLFMNPFDVVMTRSYNTHIGSEGKASNNIFKQVLNIYRVEGVRGMYKGSVALFARSAPHSVATFVVLEWVRKMRETHTPNRAYTKGSSLDKKSIGVFNGAQTEANRLRKAAGTGQPVPAMAGGSHSE